MEDARTDRPTSVLEVPFTEMSAVAPGTATAVSVVPFQW